MAQTSDSSDSDGQIGSRRNPCSSGKRVMSSSEEETNQQETPLSAISNNCANSRRHSLRKRQKIFQLPSREDQWNSIKTESRVCNKLSRLKPRKLVNDFTRVTHRYNYDYVEVSGEESMDDFIKSSDSSDSSESSSTGKNDRKKQKGHRVKGFLPRIVKQSDESSEDDHPVSPEPQHVPPHSRHPPVTNSAGQPEINQQQKGDKIHKKQKKPNKKGGNRSKGSKAQPLQEKDCASSDEDSQTVVGMRKNRTRSALDSDSGESNQSLSSDDSQELKKCKKTRKASVLHSDTDKDVKLSVLSCDEDSQDIGCSSLKKARMKSVMLSDSELEEEDLTLKSSSTNEQASISKAQECDKVEKNPSKSMHDRDISKENLVAGSSVSKISAFSEDSAILISDDDSDESVTDEASNQDSSDGVECSRIQKLAVRKRKRRDSMFERLKSARAKLHQKDPKAD